MGFPAAPLQNQNTVAAVSGVCTQSITPSGAGTLLIAYVNDWFTTTTPTVAGGGTWVNLGVASSATNVVGIFGLVSTSTSAVSVTATSSGAGTSMRMATQEWSGNWAGTITAASQIRTSSQTTDGTTGTSTGAFGVTATLYGQLVLALVGLTNGGGSTLVMSGTGFTDAGWSQQRECSGYSLLANPGVTSPSTSWTTTGPWAAVSVALIPQAGLMDLVST
jgi:hypothetical protein